MQPTEPGRSTGASQAILETIAQILTDNGRTAETIDDGDLLRETLGLDSLDLAVLVVRLERRLGVDPFRTRRQSVRSVGDLVAVYNSALDSNP